MILGAIVGDIVGSVYEFNNHRSKEFPFFSAAGFATDDSVMTLAIADALRKTKKDNYKDLRENVIESMRTIGRKYPYCGFGGMFRKWVFSENPVPYNSFGNGAAMRVSAVAYAARTLNEVKELSRIVTEVTHGHVEGLKGAEATAVLTYLALHGASKNELEMVAEHYYDIDFKLDDIRDTYRFNETCQDTVPQAIVAFLESDGYEDAIRNAISIGGDSDTLAAITGAIAGAFYGVPMFIRKEAYKHMDSFQRKVLAAFNITYKHKYIEDLNREKMKEF